MFLKRSNTGRKKNSMDYYPIKFFQNKRGDYPVQDFIDKQNMKTTSKILHLITALKVRGPYLRMPYAKKITSNIFELRVLGKESVRVFYTNVANTFYVIHAFKKKTPLKEIKIGLERLKQII